MKEPFCSATIDVWKFAGKIVFLLKIIIPVVLILIGIIALGKAVIADDDKEIKTAVNKLIKKFIVAACIFFVPTVIKALFSITGVFDGSTGVESDFNTCVTCITSNGNCSKTTTTSTGE